MTIQFTCGKCGQVLRVGDESAGKPARCPKCSHVMAVPIAASWNATTPFQPGDSGTPDEPWRDPDTANPYLAPAAPQYPPRSGMPDALGGDGKIVNVPVDIGDILSYAFQVWKDNLAMLIGAFVVLTVITTAFSYFTEAVVSVSEHAGLDETPAFIFIFLGALSGRFVLNTFLYAGYWQMMLRMARRQPVEFTDLFGAGPVLLPAIGVSLLFVLAVGAGLICLIAPGIIIALIWWPCYTLVVDRRARVLESFGVAREITTNNLGTSALVYLVSGGILGLGFLACCVGAVVAAPLASMLTVVAYLMMSGQLPADAGQR